MSCLIYKYNKKLKRQERSLLITSKAIYNINRQDFYANFLSFFNGNFAIRRRVDIKKLAGITVSELSSEFVVHVRDEYDYRYASPDKRDKILTMLCRSYYLNVKTRPLAFYFKVNISRLVVFNLNFARMM